MKIVGIISSPHKNGATAVLVRDALKGAGECGAQVEEIFLTDYRIVYCKGCFSCMSQGRCPLPDEFETVKEKLLQADGVIISSPCYGLAPNAIFKTFADRLGMNAVYTSSMGGKYFAGISSAGAVGSKKVAKTVSKLADGFFKRGYVSGTLGAKIGWDSIEKHPKYRDKAEKLGAKVVRDIAKGSRYPFQGLLMRLIMKAGLINIFRNNVLQNKDGRMKAVYESLVSRGLLRG